MNNIQGAVLFEASHSEPIYKTIWTASKTGTELMTGGADGIVRYSGCNSQKHINNWRLSAGGGTQETLPRLRMSSLLMLITRIPSVKVYI